MVAVEERDGGVVVCGGGPASVGEALVADGDVVLWGGLVVDGYRGTVAVVVLVPHEGRF